MSSTSTLSWMKKNHLEFYSNNENDIITTSSQRVNTLDKFIKKKDSKLDSLFDSTFTKADFEILKREILYYIK